MGAGSLCLCSPGMTLTNKTCTVFHRHIHTSRSCSQHLIHINKLVLVRIFRSQEIKTLSFVYKNCLSLIQSNHCSLSVTSNYIHYKEPTLLMRNSYSQQIGFLRNSCIKDWCPLIFGEEWRSCSPLASRGKVLGFQWKTEWQFRMNSSKIIYLFTSIKFIEIRRQMILICYGTSAKKHQHISHKCKWYRCQRCCIKTIGCNSRSKIQLLDRDNST